MLSDSVQDKIAGCARKNRYSTESFALDVARQCREARGALLRAYGCTKCGGWHLTKLDPDVEDERPGWRPAAPTREQQARDRRERYGRPRGRQRAR